MATLEQRRRDLTAKLAEFAPSKASKRNVYLSKRKKSLSELSSRFGSKKLGIISPYVKKNLSIADRLKALGEPKIKLVEKPIYLGERGPKGERGEKGDTIHGRDGRDGKDGKDGRGTDGLTPRKGVDYFTESEVESIKSEIKTEVLTGIPALPELPKALTVDQELVKQIVQIMHSLPETDKLEVSKGIRNAQSFIFKGTKYGMEEMMHGGGSSSSSGGYQQPTSGTVNGINQSFMWATAPQVIIVDQGRPMQKVSSDGSINWTGTTTTILAVAPNFDIFATA